MINYNCIAWENLMKLTGLSVESLLNEINSIDIKVSKSNFALWRQYGSIHPENLVRICNHFHYPISYFSRIVGNELEMTEYQIVAVEKWTDIELQPSNLISYVTSVDKYKRKEAIARIGCSAAYYDAFRKYPAMPLPTKLTYNNFLQYINNAKIYPGDVIIDNNRLFAMEHGIHPFYNHKALGAYDEQFPQASTSIAASSIIDTKDFLMQYVTKGELSGDDKIIGISKGDLNEIASIITNLRSENNELRQIINEIKSKKN